MLKSSFFLSILSLLISILSLINQLMIAHKFGSSTDLDAFIIASSVPTFIGGAVTAGFSYSLVPFLLQHSKDNHKVIVSTSFFFLIFVAFLITFLGYIISKYYLLTYYPQYSKIILLKSSKLSWSYCFCSILMGYFTGVLNSEKSFFLPMILGSFPYIGVMIGLLFLLEDDSTINIAFGLFGGAFISLLIYFIVLRKELKLMKIKSLNLKSIIDYYKYLPFVVVGMFCFTIYQSVDSFWAPTIGASNLSYLSYCQRMIVSVGGLVIVGPSVILVPFLSDTYRQKGVEAFLFILFKAIRLTVFIGIYVSVILVSFSQIITKILFERGSFDESSVKGVSEILPYFALGMIPMICVVILFRAIMIIDKGKRVAMLGIITLILYFLFSGLFSKFLGLRGVGLAYITTWLITFIVAFRGIFKNHTNLYFNRENMYDIFKYLLLICYVSFFIVILKMIMKLLFENSLPLKLVLSGLLTLVTYIKVAFLLGIQENQLLIEKLKKYSFLKEVIK